MPILTTDYSAGVAHCPAYKASIIKMGGHNSIMREQHINWECEHGRESVGIFERGTKYVIEPDPCDVIASLVMDSDVLDADGFEGWANNIGFDTDSRKAETIYKTCLNIALKLRNGIGEAGLQKLREACQDY